MVRVMSAHPDRGGYNAGRRWGEHGHPDLDMPRMREEDPDRRRRREQLLHALRTEVRRRGGGERRTRGTRGGIRPEALRSHRGRVVRARGLQRGALVPRRPEDRVDAHRGGRRRGGGRAREAPGRQQGHKHGDREVHARRGRRMACGLHRRRGGLRWGSRRHREAHRGVRGGLRAQHAHRLAVLRPRPDARAHKGAGGRRDRRGDAVQPPPGLPGGGARHQGSAGAVHGLHARQRTAG